VSDRPDYLERIVPAVRRRLDERRALTSLTQPTVSGRSQSRRSLAQALSKPGISLIAEVKRASPSKGPIRPDLQVVELVRAYEAAGARAVSVLTEQDFFGGSLEDLRLAVASTGLPVLRKDFIFDEYQVYEAEAYGASAILLIAALLDDACLGRLAESAAARGLDVLLEVHDAAELERALAVEGAIIGVNNRDLRTFEVSLETTVGLAAAIPKGRLLVSESGIRDRHDVERLAGSGVDAVLVGESLLVTEDAGEAVRGLIGNAPAVAPRSKETTGAQEGR